MKNKLFVAGAVAVVALAFVAMKFFAQPQMAPVPVTAPTPVETTASSAPSSASVPSSPAPQAAPQKNFVRPHNARIGNTMARVTVVEWFDPECESCRAMHPIVKNIIADYKDRVLFVFRYMPYHPGSKLAASALEEARELGRFEAALDLLYEKQPEWGDHHHPRSDLIPGYLQSLGIPKAKTSQEYLLKKHLDKILMDEADGNSVGVQGTPTFFVNGIPVARLGDQPVRGAIESALNAAK